MVSFTPRDFAELRAAVKLFSEFRDQAITRYGTMQNWNTINIDDMADLFSDFEFEFDNQTDIVSGWDVSKVTDFSGMFAGCESLNQDLSRWDISSRANMNGMFEGAITMLNNPEQLPRKYYNQRKQYLKLVEGTNLTGYRRYPYVLHPEIVKEVSSFASGDDTHGGKKTKRNKGKKSKKSKKIRKSRKKRNKKA
jgi:surface protein